MNERKMNMDRIQTNVIYDEIQLDVVFDQKQSREYDQWVEHI